MKGNTPMSRSILMLAANPTTSPLTGWPIGFWWAELSHAWLEFSHAGYDITIASPDGGDLEADGYSDPDHESGYSAHDIVSKGFKDSPATRDLIRNTPALGDVDPEAFDAIFVVGGQSPMVTMIDNERVHQTFAAFFEAGKIASAVCHGTCILLRTRLSDGSLLVSGKTWTGFADSEERYSESAVGQKIQPFWIETEARKIDGTNFITGGPFAEFAVRDGNLITGQQQVSSAATARKIIAALGA